MMKREGASLMESNGLKKRLGASKHNLVTAKARRLILMKLNRRGWLLGKKLSICLMRGENKKTCVEIAGRRTFRIFNCIARWWENQKKRDIIKMLKYSDPSLANIHRLQIEEKEEYLLP
jgi:hypothetical protein